MDMGGYGPLYGRNAFIRITVDSYEMNIHTIHSSLADDCCEGGRLSSPRFRSHLILSDLLNGLSPPSSHLSVSRPEFEEGARASLGVLTHPGNMNSTAGF